jgi:hypothetical protein
MLFLHSMRATRLKTKESEDEKLGEDRDRYHGECERRQTRDPWTTSHTRSSLAPNHTIHPNIDCCESKYHTT